MAQRREIREVVLQALFAEEVSGNKWKQVLSTIIKPKLNKDKSALKFAERLFLKTVKSKEELDNIIQDHIKNWNIHRLATVDKLILRLALCEFLNFEEIPTKVTINEAIEIAKRFSTQKSGNFVNGILDAALERLQKEDRIHKTGRGLIESSLN
ncbi:transcription antitermination factor NusB [Aliifodinibius sp. S!AR15-10]|uniref:transcription antitermination factor NusB n=1 Tax=Aliifodinibius sp. S!AR15-10 TaxID=2950437 RepID=UPI002863FC5E|nr:transcription antitermination factor NusB [Aliifodinibius sp. S!AR15-10]MDR8392385.1 transcription antitermination factor NusB [Aliifodinibius sp. S!AR15-10]